MAHSADPPMSVAAAPTPDIGVASLYQEIILSHYRAPKHKGIIDSARQAVEHRNPLCGDVFTVQLTMDGATIADAVFSARACSITQATASMLLSRIIGATRSEAHETLAEVERLLDSTAQLSDAAVHRLGDLRALASVARFPARKACVRLVTSAVTEALDAD